MERVKRFVGIYTYTSSSRRHNGKPDVCFYASIKVNRQKTWFKIGWRSEGVTAAFASQERAQLVNQIKLGKQPKVRTLQSLSLADAWDLYNDNHVQTNTKTPKDTLSRWNSLIRDELGDKLLSEIDVFTLEGYKSTLMSRGKSPKTIEHALSLIRAIYKAMVKWDRYVGKIPTDDIVWPKYDNRRTRWLTPEQVTALFSDIKDRCKDDEQSFWRICMVALHTGMRFSEIASLRGEHVNIPARTIFIKNTKSGTDRAVTISDELLIILEQLPLHNGGLVFPSRTGGQRTEPSDTFGRCVENLGLNKGIKEHKDKVVFHTLRHTFGSWLAISGVPLYWIAILMGHSNEEVTERYSHLCPSIQRQAVDCIDAAFHAGSLKPGLWFELSKNQNNGSNPSEHRQHGSRA